MTSHHSSTANQQENTVARYAPYLDIDMRYRLGDNNNQTGKKRR
ncbi:hypothetical protein ACRN9A_19920 [Shewanella frigidimarina]